jgi:xylulokinase
MGAILSAGGSLRWFRDTFGEPEASRARATRQDPYALLADLAAQAPAGCEGLIFLPYLTGIRSPRPDPYARGCYYGVTLRHGRAHMVRAVLEGVAYGLRDFIELMRELQLPVEQVRGSGGGIRSTLWQQVIADVLDTELVTVKVTEGAAYGAALLAGVGVGIWRDVHTACSSSVRVIDRVQPGPDVERYDDYYSLYRQIYPALRPLFASTAHVVARYFGAGAR